MPGSGDRCSRTVAPKTASFAPLPDFGLDLRRENSAPFEEFSPLRRRDVAASARLSLGAACCLQARQMLLP